MIRELQVAAALVLLARGYPAENRLTLFYTPAYSTAYVIDPGFSVLNGEDDARVTCTRTVSAGTKTASVRIRITINKSSTSGFARYSDILPKGAKVESVITDGSSFSIADGKVRFVWVNAPSKQELNIEYTLTDITSPVKLRGEYSYLEGSRTKKFELPAETIDPAALRGYSGPEKPVIKNKEEKFASGETPKNTATEKKKKGAEKSASEIVFKVQVGAFRSKRANAKRLRKRFKLTLPLESEKQDGFTKFMTGRFSEFEAARHEKDQIISKNGIASAFVVAYKNGKRITVTEARELTQQNKK